MNSIHRAELEADRQAEAAAQYLNPYDEPIIESGLLSSCCKAGLKFEFWDNGTDQETGYRDSGERTICVQCREEAEPLAQELYYELPDPKPAKIVRMQGELFSEVA